MNLLWLVPVLPLAGFVLNGALALAWPKAKPIVTAIGVGSVAAAFVVAVLVVRALAAAHLGAPVVFTYWDWIPVGTLHVPAALQLDQLSAVMLLVVTGVGSLIRSEEHTSELQSRLHLVCRLLLEKKKKKITHHRR